jgi:hypothetical protein
MKARLQGYSVYLDPVLDQAIIANLKDQRNISATLRAWILVGFEQQSGSERSISARVDPETMATLVEIALADRLAEMETQVAQLPQVIRQIVEASLAEALAGQTMPTIGRQTENESAADLLAVFDSQLLID